MRNVLVLLGIASLGSGCLSAECTLGEYFSAECRVAAENHYARFVTASGVELRFQTPDATDATSWEALGVFREEADGTVVARPAGLADFAFSIDGSRVDTTIDLAIRIENVASDVAITVQRSGSDTALPSPDAAMEPRTTSIAVEPGSTQWVRGARPCTDVYRLAATGDIQTNPVQFERIVQDLHDEVAAANAAGEPLLGLLLLGDLTELSLEDEFRRVHDILASSPVPVATIPGNHDILGEEFAIYNRLFGPGNYTFDVCRTRVAMLDSANGNLAPSVEGRLPDLLDPGTQDFLVAGTHYPAYAGRTGAGFADEMQAQYLLSELVRNGAQALFTGHVHTWIEYDDLPIGDGTIDQIITGTAGGSQGAGQPHFGFTRLRFGNSLQSCFVEVPEPGRSPGEPGAGSGRLRRCETP